MNRNTKRKINLINKRLQIQLRKLLRNNKSQSLERREEGKLHLRKNKKLKERQEIKLIRNRRDEE